MGSGVGVAVGVGEGVAVAVGVGVGDAVGAGVGWGEGVAVTVGVTAGVAVAVGASVTNGSLNGSRVLVQPIATTASSATASNPGDLGQSPALSVG